MKCANIVVKLELGFVWHLNAIMCKNCGHWFVCNMDNFWLRGSFIKIIIKLGSSACLRAGPTHPPLPGGEVLVLRQFCSKLIMLWIFYNTSITFDPVNGFWHSKSHFGVVFWGQSNGDAKSPVTVQISWLQNHYHCIFWSTGRIWTIKESFWGSFSRPIYWWH